MSRQPLLRWYRLLLQNCLPLRWRSNGGKFTSTEPKPAELRASVPISAASPFFPRNSELRLATAERGHHVLADVSLLLHHFHPILSGARATGTANRNCTSSAVANCHPRGYIFHTSIRDTPVFFLFFFWVTYAKQTHRIGANLLVGWFGNKKRVNVYRQ